jgi:biotin carboxyl carrier protein
MRFLRRSLVGLVLVAVTLALLATAAGTLRQAVEDRMAREGNATPARERVFSANVMRVEPATLTPELTVFGELRSRRTLQVRASTGGTVARLSPAFEDGGAVAAGDLLVALDPTEATRAVDIARTDLAEAEAGLRDAERAIGLATDDIAAAEQQLALRERALSRARDLATRGVGSEAAIETAELAEAQAAQAVLSRRQALATAETRLDSARTTLDRVRIGLAEAERRLSETRITAEFGGVLADVAAVEGGRVSQNEKLADLIDPAALEVSFRLSTSQYGRLVGPDGRLVAAIVQVSLDVGGADIVATGTITRESAAVGEGQTGRLLYAALGDAPGFRPGDFVTVEVREPDLTGVALLPATAVDGAGTVLALGADDRLEVIAVEVLRRQGDDVIVAAGAIAGREVVAERSPLLGAGIRIRPLRPGTSAAAPAEPEFVELSAERRAALVAFVEGNDRMPPEAKARMLAQLAEDRVPAQTVARIEERMGG